MVIDQNSVLHLFYAKLGEMKDVIFESTSNDNGDTWSNPDTVSVYVRPVSYDRVHILGASATVDDDNNIHLIYRYDGPPNYISCWDAYPSSHINYAQKANDNWVTQTDVINDNSIQTSKGNSSTVSYLNDYQVVNYQNNQFFVSYDYAWWATKYHIVYSDNTTGNWSPGNALQTFDLGQIDNIMLNAPTLTVNSDTLYALWYQRYDCTIEMKKYYDGNWSDSQTLFTDKYFPAPSPTSYIVKTDNCENGETSVVTMLRRPTDTYNELILLTKKTNTNWQIDTTQLATVYYGVQPVVAQDTIYLYLYSNSLYTGSLVKYSNGGFTGPEDFSPSDSTEKIIDIKTVGSSLLPFAYVVKAENNEYYIKVGKLNNITTGINNIDVLPQKFVLEQNYPNPFNPSTVIKYSIPSVVGNVHVHSTKVELKIYDILGHVVSTLVNKKQIPGNYEVNFNATHLSSGLYFYRISAGEFVDVKKMMLLK